MQIDFNKIGSDYAQFRVGFPPKLFERLRTFDIGLQGQRVLDLGAGTGLFGRELARRGCNVVSVDPSPRLLKQPQSIVARAEATPFASESFDVVSAAQCWHWFDREIAPQEILRVLRKGGRLAVVYQMYIPTPGSIAEASERLILKHQPRWRHANSAGISGQVLRDMQSSGFVEIESFSFDLPIRFTRDAWRGFIRTTSPVGASMSANQLAAFDKEHEQLLRVWPDEFAVPHRLFAAIARKPIILPSFPLPPGEG